MKAHMQQNDGSLPTETLRHRSFKTVLHASRNQSCKMHTVFMTCFKVPISSINQLYYNRYHLCNSHSFIKQINLRERALSLQTP